MYEVDQYTVSLLHFEEGFKDECGKVWAAADGAQTVTTLSKFDQSSLFVGGSGYPIITTPMTNDFEFGSSDFTIEMWVYPTALLAEETYIFATNTLSIYEGIGIYGEGSTLHGLISTTGSDWITATATGLVLNQWNHIAFMRHGNTTYMAINGVLGSPASINGPAVASTSTNAALGGYVSPYWSSFPGYIDEFRVSKGIARWTPEPTNLTATPGDAQVSLSWNAVTGASGYNVKRSTTAGGPYTTIASNIAATSYLDSTVTNGTTYYYVVTALIGGSESANSNEASATPQAQDRHVLLRITMSDSSEREYQISVSDANNFVAWCNRSVGTGTTCYMFNKDYNVGEFTSRREYLLFDKIVSFEVMELAH